MNMYFVKRRFVIFILLTIASISVICSADITPVSEYPTNEQYVIISAVDVESAAEVTATQLAAIASQDRYKNQLSSSHNGIYNGLAALTILRIRKNSSDPFPLAGTPEKVGDDQVKAVVPTAPTFDYVLTIRLSNGRVAEDNANLAISKGYTESNTLTVIRTTETTTAVTVDLNTLPSLLQSHSGNSCIKSDALPIEIISTLNSDPEIPLTPEDTVTPDDGVPINNLPMYSDGNFAIQSGTENMLGNTNIGRLVMIYILRKRYRFSLSVQC